MGSPNEAYFEEVQISAPKKTSKNLTGNTARFTSEAQIFRESEAYLRAPFVNLSPQISFYAWGMVVQITRYSSDSEELLFSQLEVKRVQGIMLNQQLVYL